MADGDVQVPHQRVGVHDLLDPGTWLAQLANRPYACQ
jgi:hypothetical protein